MYDPNEAEIGRLASVIADYEAWLINELQEAKQEAKTWSTRDEILYDYWVARAETLQIACDAFRSTVDNM
jgi:hypothetical protein